MNVDKGDISSNMGSLLLYGLADNSNQQSVLGQAIINRGCQCSQFELDPVQSNLSYPIPPRWIARGMGYGWLWAQAGVIKIDSKNS
jgi:hypothetical protein